MRVCSPRKGEEFSLWRLVYLKAIGTFKTDWCPGSGPINYGRVTCVELPVPLLSFVCVFFKSASWFSWKARVHRTPGFGVCTHGNQECTSVWYCFLFLCKVLKKWKKQDDDNILKVLRSTWLPELMWSLQRRQPLSMHGAQTEGPVIKANRCCRHLDKESLGPELP